MDTGGETVEGDKTHMALTKGRSDRSDANLSPCAFTMSHGGCLRLPEMRLRRTTRNRT